MKQFGRGRGNLPQETSRSLTAGNPPNPHPYATFTAQASTPMGARGTSRKSELPPKIAAINLCESVVDARITGLEQQARYNKAWMHDEQAAVARSIQ